MRMFDWTALIFTLCIPNVMLAQTTQESAGQDPSPQANETKNVLAARGPEDVFVTELIGLEVHARQITTGPTTGSDSNAASDQATAGQAAEAQASDEQAVGGLGIDAYASRNSDGSSNLEVMTTGDLNSLQAIGQITDLIFSGDGRVRAVIIDVGGFLGTGQQEVAVTMEQVVIGADPQDTDDLFVVVNTGHEKLEGWPVYDRGTIQQE